MTFYNTISETGEELKHSWRNTERQEKKVLRVFNTLPHSEMTPATVHSLMISWGLISEQTPLTSIRRAMSVLTDEKKLEKLDDTKKPGSYGKPNCCWRLAPPKGQMELFEEE